MEASLCICLSRGDYSDLSVAVMSIFSSLQYCLGEPTRLCSLWSALAFMPFALFFDFMDGKIARWRRKSSLMGQELDSLADLVSTILNR